MGFWQDSSPVVKIALVIGVLGLIYSGLGAFVFGWPPFAPTSCSHEVDGAEVAGCPANATCEDGECVQTERGL